MFASKMKKKEEEEKNPTMVRNACVVPVALCEKQIEITIAVTWRKRYHH